MRNARSVACLLAIVVCAGCGYFKAGTWEDDPQNWKRAFWSTKPPAVVVVHSKYWRSPHWSYEAQYFFEIVPTDELMHQLFNQNKLLQVSGSEAAQVATDFFGNAPSWFTPKSVEQYDIWIYAEEPRGHFKILVDKVTGHLFMNDYQV